MGGTSALLRIFRYHMGMRRILLAALAMALVGCAENLEPMAEPPSGEQESAKASPGGDGFGIISPAAGTSAPVTNSDSVLGSGGGGGGVQQAAKRQAKDAAAKSGAGSLGQSGGY